MLRDEESNFSKVVSPPKICVNKSPSCNNSNQDKSINTSPVLDSQDQDILKVLEELQSTREDGTTLHNNIRYNCVYEPRIDGHFCSDAVFNLSRRILTEAEIKVLGKGLNFAPIQNKINKLELRTYFKEFCRRMRTKWYFKNEPTKEFSNIPAFSPKSSWTPPNGHPNLEVYLSQIESEVFKIPKEQLGYFNLSKLEWEAIRSLAGDRIIVIKKADKGSCVVVWDRLDYLMEAEKQLKDRKVYQEVRFSENILTDLVEKSNTMFKNLRRKGIISEKELKYFSFEYKKATNLGKLYLLPKASQKCTWSASNF